MTEQILNSQVSQENLIRPGATLGIMQPYFLPYVGYFSLIMAADEWIVFDPVQFIRHGWIERNRILKPNEGWQYISVPLVKLPRETLIKDTRIRVEEPWRQKIFRQLEHYRKHAPYYSEVYAFLEKSFEYETNSITRLNTHLINCTCRYIGIPFSAHIYSNMNLIHDEITNPGEWALNIAKAVNAKGYVNPPGGVELFDKEKFRSAGINLKFLKNNLSSYNQKRPVFEPRLSIIDVMMFCAPEEARALVRDYELFE
ncbi:MAG: WbqC family protein [Syntrophobacteraceae bacterium]